MEKQKEIWKCIPGYKKLYQVSNLGNVRSLNYNKTGSIRLLKIVITNSGYLSASLQTNKKPKRFLVHQLVAMAFLNHAPCGMNLVVNHINFNKLDNRLKNLEVITARENSNLKHRPSSSSFTGVSFHKATKKWHSSITVNGKSEYLGIFDCESEAGLYYENALISIKQNKEIIKKKSIFSSKYKGVTWSKWAKKWQLRIRVDGKAVHLGYFKSELEAYEAKSVINN